MTRALFFFVSIALACGGCRLEGESGDVGLKCTDSSDCSDGESGCVPVDEESPNGTRVCMPPAGEWVCRGKLFGDGVCDCGCEFADVDCPNLLASSCDEVGDNCPDNQDPVADNNIRCE